MTLNGIIFPNGLLTATRDIENLANGNFWNACILCFLVVITTLVSLFQRSCRVGLAQTLIIWPKQWRI